SFRYYDSRSNMAQSEPHSHSTYWSIHVVRAKAGTIAMARPEKTRLCGRYPGNDTESQTGDEDV
ncbi:MAG: hypothetical protein WA323_20840, partial [Candidatus Nitrosopolaris sp.]